MIDTNSYIEQAKENALAKRLVALLETISKDPEFILGALVFTQDSDEDMQSLIAYIETGIDVNYEQVLLNALWLSQRRNEIEC